VPDGSRVVFVDATGVASVAADGGEPRRLVTFDAAVATARQPAWSPDGRRIVFTASAAATPGTEHLVMMNADGSDRRPLTEPDGPYSLEAAWSPDGTRVAFSGGGSGVSGSWVEIVRADGTGSRRIARHCAGRDPQWSPDGRRIVFTGPHGLMVVDADGDNLRRVADTWDGSSPAWSSDGTVAFLRF
jgi:Tol biopolymer transport system component